jgi:hypothetical protein
MNRGEVYSILSEELAAWRLRGFESTRELIGRGAATKSVRVGTEEVTISIEVRWTNEKRDALRLRTTDNRRPALAGMVWRAELLAPKRWAGMPQKFKLAAILTATVLFVGCTTRPAPRTTAAAPSSTATAGPPAEVAPSSGSSTSSLAPYTDKLQTSLSPGDASSVVVTVFQGLGFLWQPVSREQVSGDYFFQEVRGTSARDQKVTVQIEWIRDGLSDLRFQSGLPESQHKYVFKQIRDAIAGGEADAASAAIRAAEGKK